ncbi:MAG: hypothetical protein MK116_09200 [Phycisphaerales bacterium]|nr:hypothetical protein [Phycisphaerales bacterium]
MLAVAVSTGHAAEPPGQAPSSPRIDMDKLRQQVRIVALIEDLRHDDVRFNAIKAKRQLWHLGDEIITPLEVALHSDDRQQRLLAASILSWNESYVPTARMLEVCLDGIREDLNFTWYQPVLDDEGNLVECRTVYGGINPSWSCYAVLSRHATAAEPLLARGLRSDDPRQRFLSALLLAQQGKVQYTSHITSILISRLENNHTYRDANLACRGLYLLGPTALPALYSALPAEDPQAKALIRHLIWHLAGPQAPEARQLDPHGSRRRAITCMWHDPAIQYPLDRMPRGFRTTNAWWRKPDA